MTGMYAVVRIRGTLDVARKTKDSLRMLNLKSVNNCVLVPKAPDSEGALLKARAYVTWGEVSPGMLEKIVLERGRLPGGKRLDQKAAKETAKKILSAKSVKGTKINPIFRLSPPRKGLKSTRLAFPKGDAGFRGEKINELLERMV